MIISKTLPDRSQLRSETINCLKHQIIIGVIVMLISNLQFIRKLSYKVDPSNPEFVKYQVFINFLIITISKVDFTKKLPYCSRLR